jgi:hypothetical protein
MQGDLLKRTDQLQEVVGQAHGYYAVAPDYTHFMVLTQSCDLVRRDGKSKPKARYITLAAVRPLQLVVDRRTQKAKYADVHDEINVCNLNDQVVVEQFVERLLNNTEDGFFCLPLGCHESLDDDLCVFLHLSIALRIDHFDACLAAKVGQLEDIFAAKLGWLTGNLYSRVATPDIHDNLGPDAESAKKDFSQRVLNQHTIWLSASQLKALKKLIKREPDPDSVSPERLRELIEEVPDDFSFVVDRVLSLLRNNSFVDAEKEVALRNTLMSDTNLKKLVVRTSR